MKKIALFVTLVLAAALSMSSCKKTTAGTTSITYYATIDVNGDTYVVHQKGDAYADEGCVAVLNGEDVTAHVVTTSDVNVNKSGIYSVVYSYTNVDGFTASASRTVVVLDANDPVEGFYVTDPSSFRNYDGTLTPFGGYEALVINEGDGVYFMEDLFGGWYAKARGADFNMNAYVSVAEDGTVELLDSHIAYWGDSADDLTDGKYDSAEKSFTYDVGYAQIMTFHVKLVKE